MDVSEHTAAQDRSADPGTALLALYDSALPHVYWYLRRDDSPPVSTPWLVGVARHKLADHWRRRAREERHLSSVAADWDDEEPDDPWDAQLDAVRARDTLACLAPPDQAALTLRYLDDLPVAEVADLLERSIHATEALLVRARRAFRRAYEAGEERDD
jgi:RNA polymerase sigma-70 factor (ECF subfamily)